MIEFLTANIAPLMFGAMVLPSLLSGRARQPSMRGWLGP